MGGPTKRVRIKPVAQEKLSFLKGKRIRFDS
jgi:hypothetical protein